MTKVFTIEVMILKHFVTFLNLIFGFFYVVSEGAQRGGNVNDIAVATFSFTLGTFCHYKFFHEIILIINKEVLYEFANNYIIKVDIVSILMGFSKLFFSRQLKYGINL